MPHLSLSRSDDQLIVRLDDREARAPWAGVAILAMQPHRRQDDPVGYGRALFNLIFADDALRQALDALPTGARLLLTTDDPLLAGLGWEYLRDREGRLVAGRLSLVRGLPPAERPATSGDPLAGAEGLEIVAIPVAPADDPRPLNTEEEWQRLVAVVQKAGRRLTLRRVRPPTLRRLEATLNPAAATVVYFMGHSTTADGRGLLEFEDERCRTRTADAADFADALTPRVALVVLNSCRSAVAAETTEFANIARGLARRGVPYALGMAFVLPDDAALVFGEALFERMLAGRPVEDAVRGARRALLDDPRLRGREWLAGVPVLYTARPEKAPPLALAPLAAGAPTVDPDPERLAKTCDLSALPAAPQFVGRSAEIGQVVDALLEPHPADFVLIHGLGGIGKTALARAVAERVSWRYGDRVLAVSFEALARRDEARGTWQVDAQFADRFYNRLARFYGLEPADYRTIPDLQQAILQRRAYLPSLLVLDNIETLFDALARDRDAPGLAGLAAFVRRLPEGQGAVLLTGRAVPTDWGRCRVIPLGGLDEASGAEIFAGLLPAERRSLAPEADRRRLSARVGGHPLSIRLLAGRFNAETGDLAAFLDAIEAHLQRAEQSAPASLEDPERQRTLYACLAYSVDRLSEAQRRALAQVGVFRSSFPLEFGAAVVADEGVAIARLQELVRLGLLTERHLAFADGSLTLVELHPVVRWYIGQRLPPPDEAAYRRHAVVYAALAWQACQPEGGYDTSPRTRYLVQNGLEDLDQALEQARRHLPPADAAALAFHLSQPHQRLGNVRRALALLEEALETYDRLGDVRERAVTQSALADVLRQLGRPQEALALYEEALRTTKTLGDPREVAVTQAHYGQLLLATGEPRRGLAMLWEAAQTLHDRGYAADAQTMRQFLAAVKAQALGPEAFDRLWQEAVGGPQPAWLQDVRAEPVSPPSPGWRLPEEQLAALVGNTIAVLTVAPERRDEWRGVVANALAQAQAMGLEDLAALNRAVLQLLDGQEADLPADNPYHAAWQQIREGVAAGGPPAAAADERLAQLMAAIQAFVNAPSWAESRQVVEAQRDLLLSDEAEAIFEENITQANRDGNQQWADYLQQRLDLLRACRQEGIAAAFAALEQRRPADLPFDPDLIPQTAAALRGSPQEKLAHLQRVTALLAQAQDPGLRAFLEAIQAALVGGDLAELGRRLSGVYAQAWGALVLAVSADENTALLNAIARTTLAVLGPVPERRSEWRDALAALRNQATAAGDRPLVAFVDAVLALLDAGGNPAGLGGGLAGAYAAVWQALVSALAGRS